MENPAVILMKHRDSIQKLYIEKYEYYYFNTPTYSEYKRVGGKYCESTYREFLKRLGKKSCHANRIYKAYIGHEDGIIGTRKDICEEYWLHSSDFDKHKQEDGSYYWPKKNVRIVEIEDRFYGVSDLIRKRRGDEDL